MKTYQESRQFNFNNVAEMVDIIRRFCSTFSDDVIGIGPTEAKLVVEMFDELVEVRSLMDSVNADPAMVPRAIADAVISNVEMCLDDIAARVADIADMMHNFANNLAEAAATGQKFYLTDIAEAARHVSEHLDELDSALEKPAAEGDRR